MNLGIQKAGLLSPQVTDAGDLTLINAQSSKQLTAEEVFTFKVRLCDNQPDRDNERFTDNALEQLSKLFMGKTVISDHHWSAGGQVARIYQTEVLSGEGDYKGLYARCYVLRLQSNDDLISSIEGGIKREVSVGCRMGGITCSICGNDLYDNDCPHIKGQEYGGAVCLGIYDEALDAYELSFVAVPAQVNAGVVKGARKVDGLSAQTAEDLCKALGGLEAALRATVPVAATPPEETPPAETPPATDPPAETPPDETPPAENNLIKTMRGFFDLDNKKED